MRRTLFLSTCLLVAACKAEVAPPTVHGPSDMTADIEFSSLLSQDIPEQDVFIEEVRGGNVYRFEVRPTENMDRMADTFRKPTYGSVTANPHDYFKTQSGSLGPFQRGVRIGFVLQAWGGGKGNGTYTVKGGTATVKARFRGLIRGGTYSLWCSKVSKEAVIEWPCVAAGEPGNPLKVDARGRAALEVSFPALPDATTQTGAWISLAYHSDHHQEARTNDFGKNTHVQILTKLPKPSETVPAW